MTWLDWLLVFTLNGAVIAYGLYLARGTKTSSEWFLGARALPWWGVGMSMFATNVDNADLVGVTGATYNEGLHIISVYAVGSALGGILAAFVIVPTIYRLGFYTNAEYLEARYGPAARAASALIQLQYRSSMLGLMTWSVYLLLRELVGLSPPAAWTLIVAMVVLSGIYTAWGGLKSVVWTDALQGLVMMVAGAVIFAAVWRAVGGWSGMTEALAAAGSDENGRPLSDLPHMGRYRGDTGYTSPLLVVLGWTIVGSGYWTVNHTQTMRLMGTRSLWDMQMAAVLGVAASLPIMVACACLGVFARALQLPEIDPSQPDLVYPILANKYLVPGLKGLVVAGVVAAAVSTFDSMGSALSAIFTRDIYARFLARDRDDAHYVRVGRLATIGVLALGFLYLPFIVTRENMIRAFTTLIPVFVTPLFTIYVVGVTTRAHRQSGLMGLAVGSAYGVLALIDREFHDLPWMPEWLSGRWIALSVSFAVTAATMAAVTWRLGRQPQGAVLATFQEAGWLQRSREALPPLREHPFADAPPLWSHPALWAAALMALSVWVVFGLFW